MTGKRGRGTATVLIAVPSLLESRGLQRGHLGGYGVAPRVEMSRVCSLSYFFLRLPVSPFLAAYEGAPKITPTSHFLRF